MQMTVSPMCGVQLQPDLAVAADGTFCSPSKGGLVRGERAHPPYVYHNFLCVHLHRVLLARTAYCMI
jgi:hypothetical protein